MDNISDQRYRYTYTVTNDGSLGSQVAVKLFDIQFDTTLYNESTLTITPLQGDWDEMVLSSMPGDPPAYDAFSSVSGIPAGQNETGFSIEFDWLGNGEPGTQRFEIYDPGTFALLESGTTVLESITVTPGDANGDSTVNVLDVIAVINMVFNGQAHTQGADCNTDSKVNVLDVICLINKVF